MASERTVSARWLGGYQVDVQAGEFGLRVDEPERVGGTNTGPQPTDLLLAAVSSCMVLSLAWAAAKRGIEVPSIAVEVVGEYEGPRFRRLEIIVDLPIDEATAERLIESARRVCYVTNTLASAPEIEVRRA